MKQSLTPAERKTVKFFRKCGFKFEKLDNKYRKFSCPDFHFYNNKYFFLAEIKVVEKFGRKAGEVRDDSGKVLAYRIDLDTIVDQVFLEVTRKYKELIKNIQKFEKFPYAFVCFSGFGIDKVIFSDSNVYEKYPEISAVFVPDKIDPNLQKWWNMPLNKLEEITRDPVLVAKYRSMEYTNWKVKKNNYAKYKLDLKWFSSITKV